MAEALNAREILEIAVHVEENGEEFYAQLEKRAKEESLRRVWCYLKEQEKNHRDIFLEMIAGLKENDVAEFSPGEYSAYFNAIARNYIITQKLMERKKREYFASEPEALEFGITIEKESILTYSAVQEYLPAGQKKIIERIIDEEKQHLVQLTAVRDSLLKGG